MKPQSYTVSVIANVTLSIEVTASDEIEAAAIVDDMTYEELAQNCRVRIYSTDEIDPDQDVVPSVDSLIADILSGGVS